MKVKAPRRAGPLEYIEVSGDGDNSGPVFVVLHGYGADFNDLVSVSRLIGMPPGSRWIFPNGTMKLSEGGVFGRAWFPIDVERLDAAARGGEHVDLSQTTPPGMKQAREQILGLLKELSIPLSRVIIGGFSQGAMLATDIALGSPEKVAGLVILSGVLLNEPVWTTRAKNKAGLQFFQSHGDQDALLSVDGAQRLEKVLVDSGLKGKLRIFRGGHEIPQQIIHDLNQFIKKLFTTS